MLKIGNFNMTRAYCEELINEHFKPWMGQYKIYENTEKFQVEFNFNLNLLGIIFFNSDKLMVLLEKNRLIGTIFIMNIKKRIL